MNHYLFYSNADNDGQIEWPEDLDGVEYGIHTKSPVKSAIGAQIWFISGRGSPKQFELSYMFTADSIEPLANGQPGSRLSGSDGCPFVPPIPLNDEPWFNALRRTQFWSLGLFELKLPEVVDGLLEVLDAAAAASDDDIPSLDDITQELSEAVSASLAMSASERLARLAIAPRLPARFEVVTTAFDRNPDVIVAVLERAKGICERCLHPAPFVRRSDGTPYLEVHHWTPLSEGGEDTVDNAGALCPNCHREVHFG